MNSKIKNKRSGAQATLEQLILLSVVLAIFILMVLAKGNLFQGALTNALLERAMWMEGGTIPLGDPTQVEPSLGTP